MNKKYHFLTIFDNPFYIISHDDEDKFFSAFKDAVTKDGIFKVKVCNHAGIGCHEISLDVTQIHKFDLHPKRFGFEAKVNLSSSEYFKETFPERNLRDIQTIVGKINFS